jgi:putative ABC transport system ATP-binding protein
MNQEIIRLENLSKTFISGEIKFTALKDINLSFKKSEFTGLVGPSGSGKTTLLNIIGLLDKTTDGKYLLFGKNTQYFNSKTASEYRKKHIGFIFQTFNLLPLYTVYENIELALLLLKKNESERKNSVMQALELVGLKDLKDKKPPQLSGGEAQRVAIARAIVKKPEIVIADEPTANLDAKNAHSIMQTMIQLNKKLETSFIFATHDEKVMQYLSRIIKLEDGKVVEDLKINS